jgi:hypothetical protein
MELLAVLSVTEAGRRFMPKNVDTKILRAPSDVKTHGWLSAPQFQRTNYADRR